MAPHFPYVSAGVTTAVVGAVTSVFAAQVPVTHPVAPHPVVHVGAPFVGGAGGVSTPGVVQAATTTASTTGTNATTGATTGTTMGSTTGTTTGTPGTTPGTTPVAATPVAPNTPGSGPAALPPGFQQSAAFSSTGMNQAGQPPFGEMFYSMQTYLNQPGQPDYYDRLGVNLTALQASQGSVPFTSYQGQVGSQGTTNTTTNPSATTPPNSIGQHFTPTNTGNAVGFYGGFGPGNPNFGFYAGFTTPR